MWKMRTQNVQIMVLFTHPRMASVLTLRCFLFMSYEELKCAKGESAYPTQQRAGTKVKVTRTLYETLLLTFVLWYHGTVLWHSIEHFLVKGAKQKMLRGTLCVDNRHIGICGQCLLLKHNYGWKNWMKCGSEVRDMERDFTHNSYMIIVVGTWFGWQ